MASGLPTPRPVPQMLHSKGTLLGAATGEKLVGGEIGAKAGEKLLGAATGERLVGGEIGAKAGEKLGGGVIGGTAEGALIGVHAHGTSTKGVS